MATKIAPPSPITTPDRIVSVPPTVESKDFEDTEQINTEKVRADFRPAAFTTAMRQHGKLVRWSKAMLCVCYDETTQQAQMDCDLCDGNQYLYVDPHEMLAWMAQFDKSTKIYEKFGILDMGTTSITVEPKYRLGYRDRIEMLDSLMSTGELLKKGNRHGRRSRLPDGVDSARFRIKHMTKIIVRDEGLGFVTLENGVDYNIDDNGWIKWTAIGDGRVDAGAWMSVRYDFHPSYLVTSWPHATRDDRSGRKTETDIVYSLPIQAKMDLEFLVDSTSERES